MFNFFQRIKCGRGFTILETLMAMTALLAVFSSYFMFTQSQNREVKTVTQRSKADENTMMAIQVISADVKSAKLEGVAIDQSGKSMSIMRYFDNPDIKKSDQLYLQQVDYAYDQSKKTITRTITKLEYNEKNNSFDKKGSVLTNTFKDISSFNLKKIPLYEKGEKNYDAKYDKHTLAVAVEVESRFGNDLIGKDQVSYNQDIFYVREEVAFKNQPHWNKNPIFSNKLVNITLSPPATVDFASSLDIVKWANNFKNIIPNLIDDGKQFLYDATMGKLSSEFLAKANELFGKYATPDNIQKMIQGVQGDLINCVEEKDVAAAAILRDALFAPVGVGEALKNKILNKALTDQDILSVLDKYNYNQVFGGLKNKLVDKGVLSQADFNYLEEFKKDHVNDQNRYMNILAGVKNKIYASLPTVDKFSGMVRGCSGMVIEKMKDVLHKDAIGMMTGTLVRGIVEENLNPVIENIKSESGLDAAINESIKDDVGKEILNQAVGLLESGIKGAVGKLVGNVVEDIAKKTAGKFKNKDEALQDAQKNVPNPVAGTVSVLAQKFMLGETWDKDKREFVKNPNARNYVEDLFKGFNLEVPTPENDKAVQGELDKFYADNNLQNPFNKK